MKVSILKSWEKPDLFRQTPGASGKWKGTEFCLDFNPESDLVVALNHIPKAIKTDLPKDNIWCISQEPPVSDYNWYHDGYHEFGKIITQDPKLTEKQYHFSHGALPWHVGKSYDELTNIQIPEKTKNLSWITSNLKRFDGHKTRMSFLENLKAKVDFDLFGRGFNEISDKWDGLSPYKYSLAIENYSGPFYWTEKIADCFLSYTFPIYYGCTNLSDYFPENSYAWIDINDSSAYERINDIINSDLYERNHDAIRKARDLVLNKYQIFPFLHELLSNHQLQMRTKTSRKIKIAGDPSRKLYPRIRGKIRSIFN